MGSMVRPLAAALLIVFGASVGIARADPAQAPAAKPAVAKGHGANRKATSLVAKGTISAFDRSTNTLTITTSKGQEQFTLPATARIQEASRHLTVNDLDGLNGRTVNVRYRESGGQRTVQSVNVAAAKKART
jgi:hypothetical protein